MSGEEDRTNGMATYPAWSKDARAVLDHFSTDPKTGLSAEQVAELQATHGFNELDKEPGKPLWKLVLEQFEDTLVRILLLAALVSFVLAIFEGDGEGLRAFIEPCVILLILILNAIVGVWQEANAENALEALKDMQPAFAKVVRGGRLISELPTRELVPGDIVHMAVGDKVPADLRIIHINTATLRSEQASLTGESVAVMKTEDPTAVEDCDIQSKECMLFSGTAIANGSCVAVVTSTGMRTEMGKIQADITTAGEEDSDTPLKRKLNAFGETLAQVIFYICVVVWAINYSHFLSWSVYPGTFIPIPASIKFSFAKCTYYFKIAVALAVAAIPEGLPAVITTCLALGTRKMAQQNAIIRRLPSVETLGCTTVICSDKTGTLTTNQMSAVQLVLVSGESSVRTYDVKGFTYNPNEGGVVDLASLGPALDTIANVCAVCNESSLEVANGAYKCVGAPTEAALVVLAEKLGLTDYPTSQSLHEQRRSSPEEFPMPITNRRRATTPSLALLEFDRRRKSMSVIVRGDKSTRLLVKGAAECVLERCTRAMLPDGRVIALTPAARATIERSIASMADAALRTLAFATRDLAGTPLASYDGQHSHPAHAQLADVAKYEAIESDMVFLGLVGLQDPPRPEVRQAISECAVAGIKVIVITGDNKATAESICRKIGVFDDDEDVSAVSMVTRDFVALPRSKQLEVLSCGRSCCFSRAEPRNKQDIVRLLKEMGEIVAMTGDGVNDAPALKLADIGVAMGIAGTEVAKEASDMVLADDNFSTIVAAVREGRSIFDNMKAFIRYMISSNIGEVASIFFTAALGMPEGMIPVQLLWVNLVTDGPPATALGFNPPDKDVMLRHPRDPKEPLITTWVFIRYIVVGTYVGFATVGIFAAWYLFPSLAGIPITSDGHTNITWQQLTNFSHCESWPKSEFDPAPSYGVAGGGTVTWEHPCDYFEEGKIKACTLSLTVLVAIEMLNALNALSEDSSLITMPPWCNPWLLVAMAVSFGLHFVIMYIPVLAGVFSIVPLTFNEWLLVLLFASPVLLIDEVLKFLGRNFFHRVDLAPKLD